MKIKRVYEKPEASDGVRVLVDRLWPRGLTKEKAKIDKWLKEIAPSNALRKRFAHKPEHWEDFKMRYLDELRNNKELISQLKELERGKTITLLYAAKDKQRNNAQVLFKFLRKQR